jgi:N-acetylneuraminate synthase/N,N'-diacetyllegionaminate synthase
MKKNIINNINNFFIAEIGTNHNQKISIVKKMIKKISQSGCQCVKYQIYESDEIVNKKVLVSEYNLQKFYGNILAHVMFDKYLKTPKKWFPNLINYGLKYNLKTAVTIHGENGLAWAVKNKIHFVKIASMDHNNFPFLLKAVKVLRVPILVSLGMAKLKDIKILIKILSKYKYGYGVLHCTSLYPPQRNELRLNNILFLKKKYNIPVGFSDHSENEKAAIVAKSYGATFFEKHVTLDKKMIGPDHAFALNLKMLKNYVNKIKKQKFRKKKISEKFLDLSNREKVVRKKYLKGLIASRDIKKNTIIKTTHIKICRPLGNGMEPKYFTKIIGKKTRSFIKADNSFMQSDISR